MNLTSNFRAIPFFRLFLSFALGIYCNFHFNESLPYPLLILAFTIVIYQIILQINISTYRKWLIGILVSIGFFSFGWQFIYWNNPINQVSNFHYQIQEKNKKHWISGTIENIPTTKKTTKVILNVQQIGTHRDSLYATDGKLLCYLQADSLSQNLKYGEQLIFHAFVNETEPPKNPYQFDYKQFLAFKKIHHQTYLKIGTWRNYKYSKTNLFTFINKIRADKIAQIKQFVKGEAEQGVAMALLLGYKEELSKEIQTAYAETGAIHVLAVSGLHVGIVAAILSLILGRFRWGKLRILKPILIIFPLWFYAFLTGFSPSVIRATIMFSFVFVGLEMKNRPDVYNVLAASAFVILLIEPYFLFSVGFQLSYAAVLGIVYFQPKIAVWYLPKYKIVNYFWQLTSVSIAATLGTLPFTLYYFHQFPIWFWLSSAIVIPAAALILSLGLVFFTFGLIPGLDMILGRLLSWTIWAMNGSIQAINNFPITKIKGLWFTELEFYIIAFSIITLGIFLQNRRVKWFIFSLISVVLLSLFSFINHIQSQQQQQVVIYNANNNSIIDFVNKTKVYSFRNKDLRQKDYQFASQDYQYKLNISTIDSININDNFEIDNLKKEGHFIQFHNTTFLIINKETGKNWQENDLPKDKKINIDYLILRENPKVKMTDLANQFDFEKVIFDASNSFWYINNWKKECENLEIPFHDVKNDFAFVLNLDD